MRRMRLSILLLMLGGSLFLVAYPRGAERDGTTIVTPPWTHCLGLHKATQFHLDIYSGYREKFNDPQGIFCTKLASKDKQDTRRDDDELTVYGVNSGNGNIIYNKSLISIGIVGAPGGGPLEFRNAQGLTGDGEGNLFIADAGNDRIAHLRYEDDELVWIGEIRGLAPRMLREPSGVSMSGGKLFVADTGNDRIVLFDLNGSFIGSFSAEFEGASLFRPYSIAAITGQDEYLYYGDRFIICTDSLGARLWKLSPEGKALALVRREAIGGTGTFHGVAIDYYGNIYVTDREAGLIHKFDRHLTYIVAIGGRASKSRPQFDEPRGISIYRRFGQIFISERAGAQYFWVGVDILRFAADNLMIDPNRRRCSVDVSFLLTEHAMISLELQDDDGKKRFTIIPSYLLPPGAFSRRIEVDCPDAVSLANCTLRLVLKASPTYSSREYLCVERESTLLVPRVRALSPAGAI